MAGWACDVGLEHEDAADDPRGRIIGTFGISRDITLRKRAEQELERVAGELRTKNQALEEDLGMARELQNALLPQQFPRFPRGADGGGQRDPLSSFLPAIDGGERRFF